MRIDQLERVEVSLPIPRAQITVTRQIGEGGFGVVSEGLYNQFKVAIKQLRKSHLTDEEFEEFKQEVHKMVLLKSPHIIQFYGICVDQSPYCIVMEYMENGSLFHIIHDNNRELSWSLREKIALDIALGLSYLHKQKLLHCDLKAMNVLLNKHMEAKLCDFGLAKFKPNASTFLESEASGTPYWMAPELFEPASLYSEYSDIFSYAITLWELVARDLPYQAFHQLPIALAWVKLGNREEIPPECPAKLSALISHCWQQTPKDRPLAADIVARLQQDPIAEESEPTTSFNRSTGELTVKCHVM